MKVFVTGGTGFIGANFVKKLAERLDVEDQIILLSRRPLEYADQRITVVLGDLKSISSYENLLADCDYIFHLGANASFKGELNYNEVNFIPTRQMVDKVKQSKVLKNFIFVSTIGVYDRHPADLITEPIRTGSPKSPKSKYGQSKRLADDYIKQSGIPYTIIHPTWVYGANMRLESHINLFVSMVYRQQFATRLRFSGKVSLIHVDDCARALVNCLNRTDLIGKEFIAETEAMSIGDIFQQIYQKLGLNSTTIKVPDFAWMIRRIHRFIPLAVANLFVDYLWGEDDEFRSMLLDNNYNCFSDKVSDVINTNPLTSGYWVITGANSGIGFALATKLKQMNKPLVLIDKSIDNLNGFKATDYVIKADLSVPQDLVALADKIRGHRIFCLINNAGLGFRGEFSTMPLQEILSTIQVNILYPVMFTRLLIEELKRHQSIIVNIASSVGYNPLPFMSIYASTKAFIINWTESIQYELSGTNRVIVFSPSGTNTNFQKSANVRNEKANKLLEPAFVANSIISCVLNSKQNIVIMSFLTNMLLFVCRFLPRSWNIKLWGFLFAKLR